MTKNIQYCSSVMAELYMQHNYRLMYDFWMEKIRPMMEAEERSDPYQQILDHFGLDNQLDKTVEECAELIVAITHWKSGKVNREEMITEIADVAVMVEQLRLAFPEVDAEKERKLKRTLGRINHD